MNTTPSISANDLKAFSSDYQKARTAFLKAVERSGARLTTHEHPLNGPESEALATDIAWLGDEDAATVLVMLSATHGVEGFSGSAAQTDFLLHNNTLPDGTAALVIHAINPHGFAWLRRVTEDGVDLNRNWIDFSSPLPVNHGYAELADALVPDSLQDKTLKASEQRLAAYREAHGSIAYEKAVSGGQYSHPQGLFYGGTTATWSRITCERIIADFQLSRRQRVALLDFHTGIGPFGYGEPICDHHPGSTRVRLARKWYGDSVTEPALGTSISVAKHGLSDYGWQDVIGEPLVFIALEFGTYPFDHMMQALRADHWLHSQSDIDWHAEQTQAIKAAIRTHFYPGTAEWQSMVLTRSRECITQAIAGLQAEVQDQP